MEKQEDTRRAGFPAVALVNKQQFREALARIRALDGVKPHSPEGRERAALQIAVSRYLSAGLVERR